MSLDTAITLLLMTLVLLILTAWLIIAICYRDTPCIITVITLQCIVVALVFWGIKGESRK